MEPSMFTDWLAFMAVMAAILVSVMFGYKGRAKWGVRIVCFLMLSVIVFALLEMTLIEVTK